MKFSIADSMSPSPSRPAVVSGDHWGGRAGAPKMAFDANDLSPIELHVIDRIREGEAADFTPMIGPDGVKPLVRAGFLRRLLIGLNPDWPVRMPGVRVRGARIEGVLDLSDCAGAGGTGLPALELIACDIPDTLDLSHARLARLALDESAVTLVRAVHARIDGPLSLRNVRPAAEVCAFDLEGCAIEGAIEARGAQLACDGAEPPQDGIGVFALNLRNARVAGSLNLRPDFRAKGGVSVFGAAIGGVLDLRGAQLTMNHRYALSAGNLELSGALHLNGGFRAEGPIWLRGARLKDGLHMDGGVVALPDSRLSVDAINAEYAAIEGGVQLRNGFATNGAINLRGARIGASLDLAKASLSCAKAIALDASNAVIAGDVVGAVTARAGMCFAGAEIARNFDLRGAEITAPHRKANQGGEHDLAIDATNVRIGGGLFLQHAKLKGEARLADARIAGYCAFGGGRFIQPGGWAIRAPNARIGGNLTFKSNGGDESGPIAVKTVVEGGAKFDRARIEGEVVWDGLELRGRNENGAACTLSFADAEIGRALGARLLHAQHGLIDLSGARCAALADDLGKGWGIASTQIALDGFDYARLECSAEDMRWSARTRWLRERSLRRSPQPYATLARVYAAAGRQDDMRRALRAQHDALARGAPASPTRIFSALFGLLSGYGLSPTRAAAALSAFLLLGMAGVFAMDWRGVLIAADGAPCAGAVEPVLYAIDVALPVIYLGQETACAPGRAPEAALFAGIPIGGGWRLFEEVALWRWGLALYAIFGAILTALAILTFSGVMKPGKQD